MPALRTVRSGSVGLQTGPIDGPEVLTVGELNRRAKAVLEGEPALRNLHVEGELSNWRPHANGHYYFTLKQDRAAVDAVMWRSFADARTDGLRNGVQVLVVGDVSLYEPFGKYQLLVRRIEPAGEGLLWLRLAELKKRLAAEGLFEAGRKRALPRIPRRIGVVTSRSGAALHDILNVLKRRAPYVEVVVADARVQGDGAVPSIVAALGRLARTGVDVIIVARGGGSLEDLWAFNEEAVVRAIAACPVPTISAVGHETDHPLSDLAADLRCPTPSAAAEHVAPSVDELIQHLDHSAQRLAHNMQNRLALARHRFDGLATRPLFTRPDGLVAPLRQRVRDAERRMPRALAVRLERARARVDDQGRRLPRTIEGTLAARRAALQQATGLLDALSPLKVLARGYAVASTDGHAVVHVDDVAAGDRLDVRVTDGIIVTQVKRKEVNDGTNTE